MNLPKTNWYHFHSGNIPQPKRKAINYSLIYANGVVVCTGKYSLCVHLKKQHPLAVIKPNYQ
jgi:hypothetical protein